MPVDCRVISNENGDVRRIVVSRLRHLGDVVLTTPALDVLRERFPRASLEYVTQAPFAGVLEHHPSVDRVLTLPLGAGVRDTLSLARELRRPRVDWLFDLFANPRSVILTALARPRRSVGTDQGFRTHVFTHRRPDPGVSQIALHLDKLTPLIGPSPARPPRIFVTPEERQRALSVHLDSAPGGVVLLHPGASKPWRQWPLDRWAALVERIRAHRPACRIRIVSPPGASEEARTVVDGCGGTVHALPAMGLRDLLGVLSWASLFVGNDGGILHSAVALGVPTVGVIGGENDPAVWFPYEEFGPYRAVQRVSTGTLQGPRGRPVGLPDATPDEVMSAVVEAWG